MINRTFLTITGATIWISLSEFLRNQLIFGYIWEEHYANLGLSFPAEAINGALWGFWSLLFAILLFVIRSKFSFWQTIYIGWIAGFFMMWIVLGNLLILPIKLLIFAVPLSIFETIVAVWLIDKIKHK